MVVGAPSRGTAECAADDECITVSLDAGSYARFILEIASGLTGKAKTSKQYRGSSDIPAAVDMAYKLDGDPRDGGLHRLTLTNFKNRFAPEAGAISMEFRKGSGFEPIDAPGAAPRASVESVVEEIISAQPGMNGELIVERAKPRAGKNKVRAYLKDRARKKRPDDWQYFRAETLLGASLAGQKKYAEAEPLLLEGYQGMAPRKKLIPVPDWYHLDRAREWIAQLYQAWGQPEKATEWRSQNTVGPQ
jgi:hypothetical protein